MRPLLLLNGVRGQWRQRETAEASRTSAPEPRLAKCFVRDELWVTPSLNRVDKQESEGGGT